MSEIEIRTVPFDAPVAQHLIRAALADLGARYHSSGDETPVDATEFEPPDGVFLVAYLAGEPVGCGGWRSHGEGTAELKRMYTAPAARGRGVARTVLAAVERSARDQGRKRVVLECGDKQPEAIAMYRSAGYERIPNFGFYKDAEGCISFGRTL
ncbi:GNAT family N-acetyltransferase [Micromonospora sp. WMMD1120]|uniref:GNAT family N-acetyltransferase n=1 Tax=Micromonospora sp. WMMD1120 TaxID=3016106 RepID=UPI002416C84C|nr:GNAT family N-acetyltransferase [Micromonospora sp. WMMD1120]MDG4808307.1 GNAT family N-acetyltransferase [Micromonospora sp. WMMD1120]